MQVLLSPDPESGTEEKKVMSSQISTDDLENYVWREFGCRNPETVRRFMMMVRAWGALQARNAPGGLLEDAPLPEPGPYDHLRPGEYDLDGEVTCCDRCAKVKDWDLFHVDKDDPTGHRRACRQCRRGRRKKGEPVPERRYKCRICGTDKVVDEFPPVKKIRPSLPMGCLECRPLAETLHRDVALNDEEAETGEKKSLPL